MPAPQELDLLTWRNAVCSERGPKRPTVRHVLLTIAARMRAHKLEAWPSIEMLAKGTALNERTVRSAVREAINTGWLAARPRRSKGQNWRNHIYTARLPREELPEGAGVGPSRSAFKGAGLASQGAGNPSERCGHTVPDVRAQDPIKSALRDQGRTQEDARATPAPEVYKVNQSEIRREIAELKEILRSPVIGQVDR